jgi:GNAT superfamily N-acetyltransferase
MSAMARLGLWRLSRHPLVRSAYEWLGDRGLVLARLDRYERPTADAPAWPDRPDVTVSVAPVTETCPDRLRDEPIAPDDRVVLAGRDGRAVGSFVLSSRPVYVPALERRLRPPGVYGWELFVEPAARGEGVGTDLIRAAVAWTGEQPGVERCSAFVAPDNRPSRRAFAAAGFRPTVRHTAVGLGRWRLDRRERL